MGIAYLSGCAALVLALPMDAVVGGTFAGTWFGAQSYEAKKMRDAVKNNTAVVYQANDTQVKNLVYEAVKELNWSDEAYEFKDGLHIIKTKDLKGKDVEFGIGTLTKTTTSVYAVRGNVLHLNPFAHPETAYDAYTVMDQLAQARGIKKISDYNKGGGPTVAY
jgi:hypothetical protein